MRRRRSGLLGGKDPRADRIHYLREHPPDYTRVEGPRDASLNEWTVQAHLWAELNRMGHHTVGNVRVELDRTHSMFCDLVVYRPDKRPLVTIEVKPEPPTKWKGVPDAVLDQMFVYDLLPYPCYLVRGMVAAGKFLAWVGVHGWPTDFDAYKAHVKHYDPKLYLCLPARVPVPERTRGFPLADKPWRVNWWKDPPQPESVSCSTSSAPASCSTASPAARSERSLLVPSL